MTQNTVTANLGDLDAFLDSVGRDYAVKVGLVGEGGSAIHMDGEEETDMDNAAIGLIQEFGSVTNNIPPRSFLRMPLEEKQREIIDEMKEYMAAEGDAKVIDKGFYEQLGAAAVKVIQDAFSSGGFGQWPPNTDETAAKKGSSAPLINTSQLRKAVDYEVVRNKEV